MKTETPTQGYEVSNTLRCLPDTLADTSQVGAGESEKSSEQELRIRDDTRGVGSLPSPGSALSSNGTNSSCQLCCGVAKRR